MLYSLKTPNHEPKQRFHEVLSPVTSFFCANGNDWSNYRHLSELELRLFGTQSVDVALFQDSFGSGAMGVEIPPHWNPQAPPAFSHPHREPHQSNEHLPAVAEAMSSVQDAV
eukprot:TRINITY_DN306_c0_g1_i1.p2 TRINITY_DN306_c0_g1~~TRINITY_DN306_c0_g1_i1.p2  ORF type:complete len:112 (-),score=8.04 TRINITY_DN306_c0_g1_i1:311-646(-)